MFATLGPRRPIKRPKPIEIECTDGNFIYQDGSSSFQSGEEVFVCTDENIPEFKLLEPGNYTLKNGINFQSVNGFLVVNE